MASAVSPLVCARGSLLLAEQALVGGALDDDPEAKQLFEESSLFQETWRSQVRGLKTKLKEAEKLKSKGMGGKAKGTGGALTSLGRHGERRAPM